MSKQAEAKAAQGYVPKAVPRVCGNCAHFASDRVDVNAKYIAENPGTFCQPYFEDRNMRCTIGLFAVKKQGTCSLWAPAPKQG